MKKITSFAFSLLATITLFAQEVQDTTKTSESQTIEIKINGEAADGGLITKAILLFLFALIIITFVLRTFRGKSEA